MMLVHDLGKNLDLQSRATDKKYSAIATHDFALPEILRYLAKTATPKQIEPLDKETLETFAQFWEFHQNWPRAAQGEMTEHEFNNLNFLLNLSSSALELGAHESRFGVIGSPGSTDTIRCVCALDRSPTEELSKSFALKQTLRQVFDGYPRLATEIFEDNKIPFDQKYYQFLCKSIEKLAGNDVRFMQAINKQKEYQSQMTLAKFFSLARVNQNKAIQEYLLDEKIQNAFIKVVNESAVLKEFFSSSDNKVDLYYLPDAWQQFLVVCKKDGINNDTLAAEHLPNFLKVLEYTIEAQHPEQLPGKRPEPLTQVVTVDLKTRWESMNMGTNKMNLEDLKLQADVISGKMQPPDFIRIKKDGNILPSYEEMRNKKPGKLSKQQKTQGGLSNGQNCKNNTPSRPQR